MNVLESIKHVAEKATGWKRPDRPKSLVRERKPTSYKFKDDGLIPDHPGWPFLVYKRAVGLPESLDPAAVFEELFESNGKRTSYICDTLSWILRMENFNQKHSPSCFQTSKWWSPIPIGTPRTNLASGPCYSPTNQ